MAPWGLEIRLSPDDEASFLSFGVSLAADSIEE